MSQTQFDKITTKETIYKYIRKFPIKVHRGRGQNFPIFISCRYLVELGPRQLGLPVAKNFSAPESEFQTVRPPQGENNLLCEPSRELQESLGPSGPEIPKKSEKKSLGASGPGVPTKSLEKVSKKSEKSGKGLENVCSGLFRDFLGPLAPGDFFQTFWGFRARRARETPVARRRVRKTCSTLAASCPGTSAGASGALCESRQTSPDAHDSMKCSPCVRRYLQGSYFKPQIAH